MGPDQAPIAEAQAPTVCRQILALRLKSLRQSRGMRLGDVAQLLDISPSKLSRLENEERAPRVEDVQALAQIYGVPHRDAEELTRLAVGARQSSPWKAFNATEPERDYFELEAVAQWVRAVDLIQVHGLLQTPAYTAAMLEVLDVPNATQIIESRARRQQRLVSEPRLRLDVVVGEAALRTCVGSPEVMCEQIDQLLTMGEAPNVVVQVLPFSAGATSAHPGSFGILTFGEHELSDVVYLEALTGQVVIETASDVVRYEHGCDAIGKQARTPEASRDLLRSIRASWSASG